MRTVLAILLCGCASKNAPSPAAESLEGRPTLVWSVEKKGVTNYFIGTCHLPIPVEDHLPSKELVTGARALYVELDMSELPPSEIFKSIWDEDLSLSSKLGRVRFAEVSRQVRGTIPAAMVERSAPWVTGASIDALKMTVEGADMSKPLDTQIMELAKTTDIPVIPVETFAEQVAVLEEMDASFDESEEDKQKSKTVRTQMLSLCYQGDISNIDSILSDDDPDYNAMLTKRNLAWFPKLSADLATGGTVVAVGALHMFGEQGLLKQAKRAGYKVKQLRSTAPVKPIPTLRTFDMSEPTLLDLEEAQAISARVATGVCSDAAMVQPCLESDVPTCEERVTADTLLCLDQIVSDKAELADPAIQNELAGCSLSGLTARALARGFPDNPVCDAFHPRPPAAEQ